MRLYIKKNIAAFLPVVESKVGKLHQQVYLRDERGYSRGIWLQIIGDRRYAQAISLQGKITYKL